MKAWIEQIKRNISRWMIGRYGADELSIFLLKAAFVLMIVSVIPKMYIVSFLAWTLAIIAIYRACSKKITARSRERDWYMDKSLKVRGRFNIYKRMWRERKTHRYFRCPKCKTYVRVPKGKGKIEITCTKCRNTMIKKS